MTSSTDRLDVLFFLPSLGSGGAESHTLRVMNHLDRSRFRVSVALGRTDGSYQAQLAPDVKVHHVSHHGVHSSSARMALSALPLRRLIQQSRPDVVCSVMDMPNLVALSAVRSLASAPALVLMVQAPPTRNFDGAQRTLMLAGVQHLYPRADALVALSHGVARELVGLSPALERILHVVHNACVDEAVLTAARIERATAPSRPRPLLLACGRLVPQKSFHTLLDAFAIVSRRVDAELWIAGEGPLRGALEAQIRHLGLSGAVRLLGFQADPQWLMARADVFVLSSAYEGFGNVLVEAMATGTPVVSTACPSGPDEIIRHRESGLLVPTDDPRALAAALLEVIEDDALRGALGRGAAARARDFDAATIAERYGDVFDRVARARAGDAPSDRGTGPQRD